MSPASFASLASLVLLALAHLTAALPAPSGTIQAKRSSNTPVAQLTPPQYLEDAAIRSMIANMAAAAQASAAVKLRRADLDQVVDGDIQKRDDTSDGDALQKRAACLDSTANDLLISSLFHYGGAGTVVELCPGATIQLTGPIFFTAARQVLTTQGNPKGDTRAKLVVAGADQACAIVGACTGCDGIVVQSIQVAGQRDVLSYNGGVALIELGGSNVGQTVKDTKLWEPRGWSALHGIEGHGNTCSGMIITGNEIGPCGHSPTNGKQFKRADQVYVPQQWADGISIACKNSRVQGNTIIDATDGGIVVFGAPGSVISGNTIIARERRPLGGINMVDWAPFSGTYEGTVVERNTIIADTNMIKAGIAIGGMVWGSDNRTASRTFGGTVRNNVFKTGSSGYFGYAIAVAGHLNVQVAGNIASSAAFGGVPSEACIPNPMVPTSQAFVYDRWTTSGSTLQNNFYNAPLVFLICQAPGSISGTGVAKPSTGTMLVGINDLLDVVAPDESSSIEAAPSSSSAAPASATSATDSPTSQTNAQEPTTTLSASVLSSTSVSSTKVPTSRKYKIHSKVVKAKSSTVSQAAPTGAAALRQALKSAIAAIIPNTPPIAKRAAEEDAPSPVAFVGPSRATPTAVFVNPFELLEKHERLK